MLKIDSAGKRKGAGKAFSNAEASRGFSIDTTTDGGAVVLGYTTLSADVDFYLIKIDSTNSLQWSKNYGESARDEGHCVTQTRDGGYVMVGTTRSFLGGINRTDILLIKVDANGTIQ